MTIRFSRVALTTALLASAAIPAQAEQVFNRIAAFAVADNLPKDADKATRTSAEIITATEDGMELIYSDSPYGAIGFVDITDPHAPKPLGALKMGGEPTSVAVAGAKALVAVNTSESKQKPSGKLSVVDIATKKEEASCDLGGQPDSIALSHDKTFAAIAIENERDEELNDGKLPQMPAGDLVIVDLKDGVADCGSIRHVAVTGLAEIAPEDPEPEFVAINDKGEIALTLQENNHIVIIDGKTGTVRSHFSAGTVDLQGIDSKSNGALKFTDKQDARKREPDAVKWLGNDRLVVANEGDYEGGSRGFTIFDTTGKILYEAGSSFEKSGPTSARAMCGMSSPIQPMMPEMETAADVISVEAAISTSRVRAVSTPSARASSSSSVIRFMRQRSSTIGTSPRTMAGSTDRKSPRLTLARLPSSQKVMAGSWL